MGIDYFFSTKSTHILVPFTTNKFDFSLKNGSQRALSGGLQARPRARLDRARLDRLLCRRLRAPLKTPTTEEPGFLGLSPALFVSKLFVDVIFNVV